jgi:GNAT superfamily N-acetyltransferase
MRVSSGGWWTDGPGVPGSALSECLTAATAAPSVHNSQPWLFQPLPAGIDVYADRGRQLAVLDPTGRELHLSLGAAIFNVRVAVALHGWLPELRLRPRQRTADLVARITPGSPKAASVTVRTLAAAIARRRSNRWPFTGLAVPSDVQAELVAAAAAEGAVLDVIDPRARRYVLGLVRVAEQQWRDDPAYRRELAAWTRDDPGRGDGIPAGAVGPRSVNNALPMRDFGLMRPNAAGRTVFEARPVIAVLYGGDTPTQWLRAGQALQRVLLTATARGVAASLLTQPLEIPDLRKRLADPASGRPAQAVIRFGYSRRLVARAPRRALSDVVVRPILPDDAGQLAEAIRTADADTLRRRFLAGAPKIAPELLAHLTKVDYVRRLALVAAAADTGQGVAIARYEPAGQGVAEVAVAVDPAWRRIGLATALIQMLAAAAIDHGIHTFTATYLAENRPVAALRALAGENGRQLIRQGIAEIAVPLDRGVAGTSHAACQQRRLGERP